MDRCGWNGNSSTAAESAHGSREPSSRTTARRRESPFMSAGLNRGPAFLRSRSRQVTNTTAGVRCRRSRPTFLRPTPWAPNVARSKQLSQYRSLRRGSNQAVRARSGGQRRNVHAATGFADQRARVPNLKYPPKTSVCSSYSALECAACSQIRPTSTRCRTSRKSHATGPGTCGIAAPNAASSRARGSRSSSEKRGHGALASASPQG